jgi:hypothetical protein
VAVAVAVAVAAEVEAEAEAEVAEVAVVVVVVAAAVAAAVVVEEEEEEEAVEAAEAEVEAAGVQRAEVALQAVAEPRPPEEPVRVDVSDESPSRPFGSRSSRCSTRSRPHSRPIRRRHRAGSPRPRRARAADRSARVAAGLFADPTSPSSFLAAYPATSASHTTRRRPLRPARA